MLIVFISCLVTFFACVLGTVCGMGGGIIIKPVLDATGVMSVAGVTFLSGCTVIAMSCWNIGKTIVKKESRLDIHTTPWLALSAAGGGLIGKRIFQAVAALFPDANMAGGVQAALLLFATLCTFLYTLKKDTIAAKQIRSVLSCIVIGLLLGMLGSFLGIGGGPFNIATLCFFYSMPTKKAAQNSLLIVLLSQLTSTIRTLVTTGMPQVSLPLLFLLMAIAILASEAGRRLNNRIDDRQATRFLEGAMILIMCINVYNIYKYLF